MPIHPTAIVSPKAKIADDATVEAFSIIGPDVAIGSGTVVGPHVVIDGNTTIGANNRIFPFVSIGLAPQDITYVDEDTRVVIGNDNIIRENVTIHKGSPGGLGITRIGNGAFLMAYAHVAHDCRIGDGVIMANAATLGGHVEIGAKAVIGGMVAIHQFVRIGEFSCMGGFAATGKDIPPYMLASRAPAELHGPNLIGLKRNGFSPEAIHAIKKFYRIFFRLGLTVKEAIEKVRQEVDSLPEIEKLVEFVLSSKRGITR
jgi:UDP-N-acetylglucosamine acyltransferase